FRWIFTRESTTTVTCHTAVSIYDNFTASQTTVTYRTTDHKHTRWVDVEFGVCMEHVSRNDFFYNLFNHSFFHVRLRDFRIMLSRKTDCVLTTWYAIFISKCDLAFCIWA